MLPAVDVTQFQQRRGKVIWLAEVHVSFASADPSHMVRHNSRTMLHVARRVLHVTFDGLRHTSRNPSQLYVPCVTFHVYHITHATHRDVYTICAK